MNSILFDELVKTELEDYLYPPSELDVVLDKGPNKRWRNFRYPFAHKWLKNPFNARFKDPKYVEWREGVIKKYDGKCQKCGIPQANQCHHIQNYSHNPELRFEVDNGILFCKKCHKQFHFNYGTHSNNEKQVKHFLRRGKKVGWD